MYIHIHDVLDHALLEMHLALLEKPSLGLLPGYLTENDSSGQVTKDLRGLPLNHRTDVANERRSSSLDFKGIKWIVGSSINTSGRRASWRKG